MLVGYIQDGRLVGNVNWQGAFLRKHGAAEAGSGQGQFHSYLTRSLASADVDPM
jgi:hypothetical protein